jgi:hypothetical protein
VRLDRVRDESESFLLLPRWARPQVVVASGGSSGHATTGLGLQALKMMAPLQINRRALCTTPAPGTDFDRLEVVFKGGQVGKADSSIHNLGQASWAWLNRGRFRDKNASVHQVPEGRS